MSVHIVDTTLRDGEQKAGVALRVSEKIHIAKVLDSMGIYQIEAGTPAMGGDEKKSIKKIVDLNLKSKISAWNRMNINDVRHSMDCGVEIIHISVPSSDIQILKKLNKDRSWVIDNLKKCINFCIEKDFKVTVGLEDASRADFEFLLQVMHVSLMEGACRIRYADTVGILYRQRIFNEITEIKKKLKAELEIHAHNDMGMAVANSVSAIMAGAEFVDCTIQGIGERAGNCDYMQFVTASRACLGLFRDVDMEMIEEGQEKIVSIISQKPK